MTAPARRNRRSLVEILTAVGVKGVVVIDPAVPGEECPGGKGGDAFDCLTAGWTPEQTREWQKKHRIYPDELRKRVAARAAAAAVEAQREAQKAPQKAAEEPPEPIYDGRYEPANDYDDLPSRFDAEIDDSPLAPIPLGYDDGSFYYFSRQSGQVHELKASTHTKMNLIAMAPLIQFWERTRWGGRSGKEKIAWDEAADFLMNACYKIGIFDPDKVRGRGAWLDQDGTVVLHLGDDLRIDGTPSRLDEVQGAFLYPRRLPMAPPADSSLKPAEAVKLRDVCRALSWESSLSGDLLAGWLVTAPLLGAMRWRPSIWIAGSAGSGKSWCLNNIIKRYLRGRALFVEAESTAKGIEQALRGDAIPVVFDEAEAEREKDQDRIRDVISLMRSAASSSDAKQYKGTIDGRGRSLLTRTCFAFSSILPSVTEYADETRVTNLKLMRNDDHESFKRLKKMVKETLTQDFIDGLFARSVELLPVILQNSETFSDAASEVLRHRRIGDQIGVFLAGAYSLTSNKLVTLDQATEWIEKQNWTDHTAIQAEAEHDRFMNHLLTKIIPVDGPQGSSKTASVMELIEGVRYAGNNDTMNENVSRRSLLRVGIRVEVDRLYVSTSHPEMKSRVFRGTPWHQKKLGDLLKMVPGASQVKDQATGKPKSMRFGGASTPAFEIPFSALDKRFGSNAA